MMYLLSGYVDTWQMLRGWGKNADTTGIVLFLVLVILVTITWGFFSDRKRARWRAKLVGAKTN